MAKKSALKKIWHFIWYEDSIWSWIVNVILAFVIIKFLLYPGIGFALGTPAPIVAVVSGSMEHDLNLNDWWTKETCCDNQCTLKKVHGDFYEEKGITKKEFSNYPFEFGFDKGDIMFLQKRSPIQTGDVIVYSIQERPDPIIHRVIDIKTENGKNYYFTKGDHNCGIASFENEIQEENILGKASIRVPFLGWIKIGFVDIVSLFMR